MQDTINLPGTIEENKKGNKNWKAELYEAMLMTKLSKKEKKENAQKLLDYFTIDNYIDERERFFEMAQKKVEEGSKKTNKLF